MKDRTVPSYWWAYSVLVLVVRPQEAIWALAWVTCLQWQLLVHWGFSCSYQFFWAELCRWSVVAPSFPWDQLLSRLWKDGLLSYLLLLSSYWRGSVCYLLLTCPAIDHLPRLLNFVYFGGIYSHILETILPASPKYTPTPTPAQLSPPSLVSCLELAVVTHFHYPVPTPTPWPDMVCSITDFPNPGECSSWYTQKSFLSSSDRVWSDAIEQWQ